MIAISKSRGCLCSEGHLNEPIVGELLDGNTVVMTSQPYISARTDRHGSRWDKGEKKQKREACLVLRLGSGPYIYTVPMWKCLTKYMPGSAEATKGCVPSCRNTIFQDHNGK